MNVARDKILIGIPTYDFRLDAALCQALLACTEFFSEMPIIQGGNALIQLARNEIAHYFLHRTSCDWLMMIDSDIRFKREDWQLLWEGDEDVVSAQYSYKYLHMIKPVELGLGFTRVHRRVLEGIAALKHADGQDMARRFYHRGDMMVDFFAQHVSSEGRFRAEDHGFFMWVHALQDVSIRVETRTRLGHVGQMCFGYPDKISPRDLAFYLGGQGDDYMKELKQIIDSFKDEGAQ